MLKTYDSAVGDEAAEVKTAVAGSRALERLLDNLVLAELILLDSLINANNILPHNAAGANVQMTDFRVAHQTLWQTDSKGRRIKLGEASGALGQLIHDGSLGSGNSITIFGRRLRRNTPTVNDDYKQTIS